MGWNIRKPLLFGKFYLMSFACNFVKTCDVFWVINSQILSTENIAPLLLLLFTSTYHIPNLLSESNCSQCFIWVLNKGTINPSARIIWAVFFSAQSTLNLNFKFQVFLFSSLYAIILLNLLKAYHKRIYFWFILLSINSRNRFDWC